MRQLGPNLRTQDGATSACLGASWGQDGATSACLGASCGQDDGSRARVRPTAAVRTANEALKQKKVGK